MTLREILRYEPRPLAFGTSGLRGLVSDLTQLEAAINTQGFIQYLLHTGRVEPGDTVWLAGDLRPSTLGRVEVNGWARGEILPAVAWAVTQANLQPAYLGAIPTPALMHFGLEHRQASIMVTGSHIPFDRNGIKFNQPNGEVLKADEPLILQQVADLRAARYREPADASPFGPDGMLRPGRCPSLPPLNPAGRTAYLERYLRAFPRGPLQDRRILVYQHSAVGRDLLVELLQALGARVTIAGRSEEFIPIDTEAIQPSMLQAIQHWVQTAAEPIEAVVSTDGDSDRPLLLGVDRGMVRFLSGDLLGIIAADYLGARHVAVPISVNDAVDQFFAPRGITVVKTRIGSPHVIAALQEVGWEANGGFLTGSPLSIPGGVALSALPTRDAFLPLLCALYAAWGQGRSLADHWDQLPPRFGRSDVLRAFPNAVGRQLIRQLQPADAPIEHVEFGGTQTTVRFPGVHHPEPATTAIAAQLGACRNRIAQAFNPVATPETILWLNFLDGVRVGLRTGDILHVRPSGNAPELRVYVTAGSAGRADELLRWAMAPEGPLRRLETESSHLGLVEALRQSPQPLRLRGVPQHYAWGGTSFLPAFIGQANSEERPWAELWFGAHPNASAGAVLGEFQTPLRRLLQETPTLLLGPNRHPEYGTELPYLLKILDARETLSIQVHPDLAQARRGFDRETAAGLAIDDPRRNYRDPHPKPEAHLALTPFWMLHGFRPLEELRDLGRKVPELSPVLMGLDAVLEESPANSETRRAWLRQAYHRLMTLPQAEIDRILRPLVARLDQEQTSDPALPETWFRRAAVRYAPPAGACDRGLFSFFWLNLVHLRPGEGTFQDAGVLHAYLEGATVELMANSDNVLRGGLTPKHIDVTELLRIVRFEEGPPTRLRGIARSPGEELFPTPAAEFALGRIRLAPGEPAAARSARGAECLLTVAGQALIESAVGTFELGRGTAALVPHGLRYALRGGRARAEVICASAA